LFGQVPIHYYEHEGDELMHGLGERASSHSIKEYDAPASKEKYTSGGCELAVYLSKKQKKVQ
jgi:hypothetical protein